MCGGDSTVDSTEGNGAGVKNDCMISAKKWVD